MSYLKVPLKEKNNYITSYRARKSKHIPLDEIQIDNSPYIVCIHFRVFFYFFIYQTCKLFLNSKRILNYLLNKYINTYNL